MLRRRRVRRSDAETSRPFATLTIPVRAIPLVLLAVVIAAACSDANDDRLPKGITLRERPAVDDSTLDCPRLNGVYLPLPGLIWNRLVFRSLSWDGRTRPWSTLRIRGNVRDSLQLIVESGAHAETLTTTRGGGYSCASGWLIPSGDVYLSELGREDSARYYNDTKSQRLHFAVSSATDGSLVGRLRVRSYSEFTVWCGDGCRGFPIPFTSTYETKYSVLTPEGVLPPEVPRDELSRRVAAEERMLEEGVPEPKPSKALREAYASVMPQGAKILAVVRRNKGWQFSMLMPTRESVAPFLGRLTSELGLTGAHEVPLYGAYRSDSDPPRMWQTVIWVPRETP